MIKSSLTYIVRYKVLIIYHGGYMVPCSLQATLSGCSLDDFQEHFEWGFPRKMDPRPIFVCTTVHVALYNTRSYQCLDR